MVLCPQCETDLDVDEDALEEGEVISCAECGMDFEVVGADPLELAPISDDGDDEEVAPGEDGEEE